MKIENTEQYRKIDGQDFHHFFNKHTGLSITWGKTLKEDPDWCPYGPLLCDIEISTICSKGCKACYKTNTKSGKNMSLGEFQNLIAYLPRTIGQIAFGIGDIDANPDLFEIFRFCRTIDIVPNVTINGTRMKEEYYKQLAELCGAVAVSHYDDDECFNCVKKLHEHGLKQVNIHQILSNDTYNECFELLKKTKTDIRLKHLKAIVFLSLKQKGDRNTLKPLTDFNKYKNLINYAIDNNIIVGFDSCGASNFLNAVQDRKEFELFKTLAEPCESTCFSLYINVEGKAFPCSFTEDQPNYKGIQVTGEVDFLNNIWNNPEIKSFRDKLINNKDCNGCRMCPEFNLEMEKII